MPCGAWHGRRGLTGTGRQTTGTRRKRSEQEGPPLHEWARYSRGCPGSDHLTIDPGAVRRHRIRRATRGHPPARGYRTGSAGCAEFPGDRCVDPGS